MKKNKTSKSRRGKHLSSDERKRLAFAVAALRYGEKAKTQAEIAKQLHVSRMQVSRLLEFAHQSKLVGKPPLYPPRSSSLEAELYRRLPMIKRVIVSWTDPCIANEQKIEIVARAAADFWQNYVNSGSSGRLRVALGGGRAISRLVDYVDLDNMGAGIEALAFANIPYGDWETCANTNLAVLKRRFPGITIRPLLAMQLSPEMKLEDIVNDRRRILKLGVVKEHFDAASDCSVVFAGIGSLEDPHLLTALLNLGLKDSDLQPPAVGDLSFNLIYHDKEVFHDGCPLSSRLITVPIETLKHIANVPDNFVAVVAWGKRKASPALDAYRAGVYNALIVDEEMAEEMISLIDNGYLKISR